MVLRCHMLGYMGSGASFWVHCGCGVGEPRPDREHPAPAHRHRHRAPSTREP